jgi:hypothetical protein
MSVPRTATRLFRRLCPVAATALLVVAAESRAVGNPSARLEFRANDVRLVESGDGARVSLAGLPRMGGTDAPELPVALRTFAVPEGYAVREVRVVPRDEVLVASGVRLGVREAAAPDDMEAVTRAFPRGALEPGSPIHPARPGLALHSGNAGGFTLQSVAVFPLRWDRLSGDLYLARTVDVDVELELSAAAPALVRERRGTEAERVMAEALASLVENPAALVEGRLLDDAFRSDTGGGFAPTDLPSLEGSPVDMVIVTNAALAASFQPLADWKTKKGVPTVIKTVEWIDANYPAGHDRPERIRDFLRDAYAKWGTYLILAGGEYDLVPPRDAHNRFFFGGTLIPTDQYFACLDGDWNADGDHLYGEGIFTVTPGDEADLYPDVFVGRASVQTPTEVATFVAKSMAYENPPATGWAKRVCYLAEVLFPENWVYGDPPENIALDGATLCDIFDSFIPGDWTRVKRYQSQNNLDRSIALQELSVGDHHLLTLMNHGDAFKFSTGNGINPRVYIADTDSLHNGNHLMFVMATACNPNQIDLECQGESFMNNPNGGAIAVCGPTREDFPVSAANFHESALALIFKSGVTRFGVVGQLHRVPFIGISQTDQTPDRWTMLTRLLLGDPELRFWTKDPGTLSVAHSASLPLGTASVNVTVTAGATPVADAVVCVSDANGTYSRGRTNAAGVATLPLTSSATGTVDVVVTKAEFRPKETTFTLTTPAGAFLALQDAAFDDDSVAPSSGNGDGVNDAGETVQLDATVRNGGGATANGVTLSAAVEPGTSATFDLLYDGVRDPAKVFVGPGRVNPAAVPFTLDFASPLIDYIGTPPMAFAADTSSGDLGVFVWQDDEGWHLRWASGADSTIVSGTVTTDGRVRTLETPDLESATDTATISAGGDSLSFAGATYVRDLWDGVDFTLADGTMLTIVDGSDALGNIAAGGTAAGEVVYQIATDARDGQLGYVDLTFTSATLQTWTGVVPLVFAGPELESIVFDVDDGTNPPVSGDGDGVIEVGETVRLVPRILNRGAGRADGVTGLATAGAGISFLDAADAYGSIAPLGQTTGTDGYVFTVTSGAGTSITLTLTDSIGRQWAKTLEFVAPAPPANLTFHSTATQIELIWDPSPEADLAGYHLYRSATPGSGHVQRNFELLRSGSRFSDTGLSFGSGFYYYATAVDSSGNESLPSAEMFAYTTQPQVAGWPKGANSNVYSSPVIYNADGAGANEVYVGSQDFRMYGWEADGSELGGFPVSTNAQIWSSPAVGDLDEDGTAEILWGSMDSRFYVVDHDGTAHFGSTTWLFDASGSGNTIRGTPAVADVDRDSDLEFFVGTDNGRMYAFNHDGTGLTQPNGIFHQTANGPGQLNPPMIWGPPAISDWNNDGIREIAFACWNDSLFVKKPDGTNQAGFPKKLPNDMRNGPVFADLDNDGTKELLVGCIDGKVYAFNHDGSDYLPGGVFATLPGEVRCQPAVANLDGDPQLEVVVSCWDGHLYAYNHDGTGFLNANGRFATVDSTGATGHFSASPIIADIDGDGQFEIFCGHRNGKFYGFHSNGAMITGMPIPTAGEILSTACAGDLDGDGDVDIVFASYDGTINVLDFGGASSPAAYPWPMSGGNPFRTSSYGDMQPYQTGVDGLPQVPLVFAMPQSEPNPFRGATTIRYSLPSEGRVMLRVFNVEGRVVRTLVDSVQPAGAHALVWDGRDSQGGRLSSGVYFYRIEAPQGSVTRKAVVLR